MCSTSSSEAALRISGPPTVVPSKAPVKTATTAVSRVGSTVLAGEATSSPPAPIAPKTIVKVDLSPLIPLFDLFEPGFFEQLSCLTPSQVVTLAMPVLTLSFVRRETGLSLPEKRGLQHNSIAMLSRIELMESNSGDREENKKIILALFDQIFTILKLSSKEKGDILLYFTAIWILKTKEQSVAFYTQPLNELAPKTLHLARATAIAYSKFLSSLATWLIATNDLISKAAEEIGALGKKEMIPPELIKLLPGNAARVFAKIQRFLRDSLLIGESYVAKRFISPLKRISRMCDSMPTQYGSFSTFANHAFKVSEYFKSVVASIENRGIEIHRSLYGITKITGSLEEREKTFDTREIGAVLHATFFSDFVTIVSEFYNAIGKSGDITVKTEHRRAFNIFLSSMQGHEISEKTFKDLIALGIKRETLETFASKLKNLVSSTSQKVLKIYKEVFTKRGLPVDQFFPSEFWKKIYTHYVGGCTATSKSLQMPEGMKTINHACLFLLHLSLEGIQKIKLIDSQLDRSVAKRCTVLTTFNKFVVDTPNLHEYAEYLLTMLGGMQTSFALLSRLSSQFADFGMTIVQDTRMLDEFNFLIEEETKLDLFHSSKLKPHAAPLTTETDEVENKYSHEQPMRPSVGSKSLLPKRSLSLPILPLGSVGTKRSMLFRTLMQHVAMTHTLNFYQESLGRTMSRSEVARHDQLHCLHKVATMIDMFQCSRSMDKGVIKKCLQRTLFPKLRLDCYTVFEKEDTAPILQENVDARVFHALYQRMEEGSSSSYSARQDLQFESLDFRWPDHYEDLVLKEDQLSRLLSSFLCDAFSDCLEGEMLAKQIEAILKEFSEGRPSWVGSVESPCPSFAEMERESKVFTEQKEQVAKRCVQLQKKISELTDLEQVRYLSRILKQLHHLLDAADLFVLFPDQNFMWISMEIFIYAAQQVIEAIGRYLLIMKGPMKKYGSKIHDFSFLVSESGLGKGLFALTGEKRRDLFDPTIDILTPGKGLNIAQKLMQEAFFALNIGKGGEYFVDYLVRHTPGTASPYMLLLLKLTRWAKAEAGFAPRGEPEGDPRAALATMRTQMCTAYGNVTSLISALMEHHI